jgi:hypothetical protein
MLTAREKRIVDRLDKDLDDLGFPQQLEDVEDSWSLDDLDDFLATTQKDVFSFHFRHVGQEEDRELYEEAEELVRKARRELGSATPNRSRRRIVDSAELARSMSETFKARPVRYQVKIDQDWPREWQHVGDSLAVAYSSDKWQDDGNWRLWKHLAESHNRAYCVPGFLRDDKNPRKSWPTIGPYTSLDDVPMPDHFADLARLEELDLRLHVAGDDEHPDFGDDDSDGVVKVTIAHGKLGGGFVMYREPMPFLFIYTDKEGPLVLIFGDELTVEADGIAG